MKISIIILLVTIISAKLDYKFNMEVHDDSFGELVEHQKVA